MSCPAFVYSPHSVGVMFSEIKLSDETRSARRVSSDNEGERNRGSTWKAGEKKMRYVSSLRVFITDKRGAIS